MPDAARPLMLQVQGLQVAYGGIQAVKGISLEVREGELVSLIGRASCRERVLYTV